MLNTTRTLFPISTSLLDWPKIERLRAQITELVWDEECSPAEAVWMLGQVLAEHIDRIQPMPDDRRRLLHHYARATLHRVRPRRRTSTICWREVEP